MKLQKLKLLSFLAVSVFFTLTLVKDLTAQNKGKGLLSEKILKSLYAKDKVIPVFSSESDSFKILFGLIEPANKYNVYDLPVKTYKELINAKFSYKDKFSIKSSDSDFILKSNNSKFTLGKIILTGKLEHLDPELNSFKYASVSAKQFSLVQIGTVDKVVALAIVTKDKAITKSDKALFYTSQNELSTLVYSEARLAMFKYATASFEQLRKLATKLSAEEALSTISNLGSSIGYWKKHQTHDEIKDPELNKVSEFLISNITNFAQLYANQALSESEIVDLIYYLQSQYPQYYLLLNKIQSGSKKDQNNDNNGKKDSKDVLKKSKSKKAKKNKSKTKTKNIKSSNVALRSASLITKRTEVKDPVINYKPLALPSLAGVSRDYSSYVTPPCKDALITHPHQASSVLRNINCAGGYTINIDGGPIPMVYSSLDRENNFLGVPGLMPAFFARITADRKFYIDAYSKRGLFKASATALAEDLKFWGEEHKYKVIDANTIEVETDKYIKVFTKLANASSPDYFISKILNKQRGALVGYHYDRASLDPVRISFRNNLNSSKLDTIEIVKTGTIVKFISSLPATEYTPVTIKLKPDVTFAYYFDGAWGKYPNGSTRYELDPKTNKIDPKKPIPDSLKYSTIEYIKNGGNFTTFAWDWNPQDLTYNPFNKSRPLIVGFEHKLVTESIIKWNHGATGRERKEDIRSAQYFGVTRNGEVTYRGEGEFDRDGVGQFDVDVFKEPMNWDKLSYTTSKITLSNKFSQNAIVNFGKYGLYTLVTSFKRYSGLGVETFGYGAAADGYRLDKITNPAYGVIYDLIKEVNTENYKYHGYLTNKGKEIHTTTRAADRTGYESIFYDKKNVEILRTKYVISNDGKYTLLETIVGNKRTTIEESGPKKTEIVRIAEKIVKHITHTANATTTTTVNELDDTFYQESSTESGGILKSTTTVNIPGYPSLTRKSEIAVAGDNYTATEKNYVGASIVKNYRETISNGEYQIKNEYPMPGSANWLSEINGATDNNKKPFSGLSIIPAQ